jgi:paraquat-inducible protein A
MTTVTAAALGVIACGTCALVSRAWPGGALACPRCGMRLRARKPDSRRRTLAFLLTAAALCLPANAMAVMSTTTLLGTRSDTIASGVLALWRAGSWPLAALIFLASMVVPALKIAALALLVVSSGRRARWGRRGRTRLYRVIERVGRWSMLDIFVMALLAALARTSTARVVIEPGAAVFAAVVVFTMLASASFDPRLIWEPEKREEGEDRRE